MIDPAPACTAKGVIEMNRKIGAVSSIVNLLAVLGFAASMPFSFNFGSYLCSMFIAFSFIPMVLRSS